MQLSKYHYYITLTVINRLIYCIYYWFMISLQIFNSSIFNIRNNILLENYNFLWLPLIFTSSLFRFLLCCCIHIRFSFYAVYLYFVFFLCCCIHILVSFMLLYPHSITIYPHNFGGYTHNIDV